MSAELPAKGHRHTRSAATPSTITPSSNPQNPHHLNHQSYMQNSQADMSSQIQPTTPPRTPRKPYVTSQNPNSTVAEGGSRQKAKNKNRPKNVNVSPAVNRTDRKTPPVTSAKGFSSAKATATPSSTAYAGPTFHASPAPSALPIPSFYSKSVPESPGMKAIKQMRDSSLSNHSEASTPSANTSSNDVPREESPLDFFFKADREEKARARSASSTKGTASATGPFQPPLSPRNAHTPPITSTYSGQRPGSSKRSSSNGIFPFEMDGPASPGSPYGPAFSTPYSERINAARAASNPIHTSEQNSRSSPRSTDKSEQLKAYLFPGYQSQSTHIYPGNGQQRPQFNNLSSNDNNALGHTPRVNGRSSGLRQEVTPTKTPTKTPDRNTPLDGFPTPSRSYRDNNSGTNNIGNTALQTRSVPGFLGDSPGERNSDIKRMEDGLRKLLKIDLNGGSTGNSVGNMPAAASSVPNYVGGRQPPLNGTHNGVLGS